MAEQNMIVIKSHNVRGLSNSMKRKRLFSWLQQTKADVLFLQETHSTPEEVKETNKEANPYLLWDTIKCVIRSHTIKFASNRKMRINADIRDIEIKLQNLQEDIQKHNADFDTIIENMEVLKHDLKIILNE